MSSELAEGRKLMPSQRLRTFAQNYGWSCQSKKNGSSQTLAGVVCRTNVPDRLELTVFRNKRALERAYLAQLQRTHISRDSGGCKAGAWRGEVEWFHGVGERGGRAFCYLSEATQRSYVTWTSDAGTPILGVARLDSLLHRRLFFWWSSVRHDIV